MVRSAEGDRRNPLPGGRAVLLNPAIPLRLNLLSPTVQSLKNGRGGEGSRTLAFFLPLGC